MNKTSYGLTKDEVMIVRQFRENGWSNAKISKMFEMFEMSKVL